MIMVLHDKTEQYLTDDEAKKVQQALAKSAEGFIQVAGMTVKKTAIAMVKPGGRSQPDLFSDPWADEKQMLDDGEDRKCKGTKSIALEIMNRARKLDGKQDPDMNPDGLRHFKLIADKDWREMMRAKLLEESDQWCDGQSGRCVCYAE
jgi:hypothetical protein